MVRRAPRCVDPHGAVPGRVEAARSRPPVQYGKFWAVVVHHEHWKVGSPLSLIPSASSIANPACSMRGFVQATWSLDTERGITIKLHCYYEIAIVKLISEFLISIEI